MRWRLIDAGQPGHVLELWFCRLLRPAWPPAGSHGLDDHYPDTFAAPDVVGPDLVAVVGGLLMLPAE